MTVSCVINGTDNHAVLISW